MGSSSINNTIPDYFSEQRGCIKQQPCNVGLEKIPLLIRKNCCLQTQSHFCTHHLVLGAEMLCRPKFVFFCFHFSHLKWVVVVSDPDRKECLTYYLTCLHREAPKIDKIGASALTYHQGHCQVSQYLIIVLTKKLHCNEI